MTAISANKMRSHNDESVSLDNVRVFTHTWRQNDPHPSLPTFFHSRPYFNRASPFIVIPVALPRSLSSRLVFFLFGTYFPSPSFFLSRSPPWHVFRAKKSNALNEGRKKRKKRNERETQLFFSSFFYYYYYYSEPGFELK